MTAAPYSAPLRFTCPANTQSRIQINLTRLVAGTSLHQKVRVVDDHGIEGSIVCTPDGGGCFRTKDGKGVWRPWDSPTSQQGCTEGTVIQYGWMAPHDIHRLITLHGGPDLFIAQLVEFFKRTTLMASCGDPESEEQ